MFNTTIEPSKDMIEFYHNRTNKHIERVKENGKYLASRISKLGDDFLKDIENHDASKFSKEEYIPYIWLTEKHRRKLSEFPDYLEKDIAQAVQHHYDNNDHHPEYWKNNINDMNYNALAHLTCDLAAMSQEFGNDLVEWIHKNLFTKYIFNDNQERSILYFANILIYK